MVVSNTNGHSPPRHVVKNLFDGYIVKGSNSAIFIIACLCESTEELLRSLWHHAMSKALAQLLLYLFG